MRRDETAYPWTRKGVGEAVEAAMDCWPRLREAFVVAEMPEEGNGAADTWEVTLDPEETCRVARMRSAAIHGGELQHVAQALRAAVRETKPR